MAQQLKCEADLRLVDTVLGPNVPWMVVKGPVLARHYYRRPELRTYLDLDILVPPADLATALDRLEAHGFRLLDRNWTMLAQRLSGELHLVSPHGGMIDLHWDLFNDSAARRSFGLVTGMFFERSRRLDLGGFTVRTLDALDTVVHTALHAARSGGDRLVWMKDLEQLILRRDFSWEELAGRCTEHRARLPVSVMLHRSRRTLGVPGLPDQALSTIGGPSVWRALGRAVDRAAPVPSASTDGSLSRMYARATRADGPSTAVELGRRVTARARRQAWHLEEAPTWDATHPQSVLYPSGGEVAKQAFLTAVGAAP